MLPVNEKKAVWKEKKTVKKVKKTLFFVAFNQVKSYISLFAVFWGT